MKILTAIHQNKHPLAGKSCQVRPFVQYPYIKNLTKKTVSVLDYYDRLSGSPWMAQTLKDKTCLIHLLRSRFSWYLRDNEVILCKVINEEEEMFLLLHDTEIDTVIE